MEIQLDSKVTRVPIPGKEEKLESLIEYLLHNSLVNLFDTSDISADSVTVTEISLVEAGEQCLVAILRSPDIDTSSECVIKEQKENSFVDPTITDQEVKGDDIILRLTSESE